MTDDPNPSPLDIIGLSASAERKLPVMNDLVARAAFHEHADRLAREAFDRAFEIDPSSETEIDPTKQDVFDCDPPHFDLIGK